MIVGEDKITETAEKLIERITANSEDLLVEIEEVFVIAVVHYEENIEEGSSTGSLFYRCTSARRHVQLGIIDYTLEAVRDNIQHSGD